MLELFLAIINILLLVFLFFKERQQEKIIKEILAFKISKDAFEFKSAIQEPPKEKEEKKEVEEVPLEEAPAEKLLEIWGQK